MYCIRHIQNSGIFRTLFIQVHVVKFKHIQHYKGIFTYTEALLRHIQAYSCIFGICVSLAYSQPCHIPNPGLFRTRGIFKTLGNFDQIYSECCHSQNSLFRHYSAIFRTLYNACIYKNLAYLESWNTQNPSVIAFQHIFVILSCI